MRKIIFLIALAGLFIPVIAFGQEKINSFDASIKINSDSTIQVSEKIKWDFDAVPNKHGIFRVLPIKYQARGGNFSLRISDISVVDESGNAYKFSVSYPGNKVEIKIGDPDKLVSGQKAYIINYEIKRAINYFSDHDELYWNVIGSGWNFPIERSSAKVILPQPVQKDSVQSACFAGAFGSQTSCEAIDYQYNANGLVTTINFNQLSSLGAGEGLTIVTGWPKGILTQPSTFQNAVDTIKDNWILFLPLITLSVMLYLWFKLGRDPRGRGTIIPQYDAPDSLTPAQIGTLLDEKVDAKDVSSEIIYLATKGYIKITRSENKGIIFKSEDYLLEKLKDQANLAPSQKRLMEGLFQYATAKSTKLSSLKNKFYKELHDIKNRLYDSLVTGGYFPVSPAAVKTKYLAIGSTALIAIFVILNIFGKYILAALGLYAILSFIASGIIIVLFSFIMPAKTTKGVITKENILGLKMYLEVAEKDRIKFHNAPEKNPQHFEMLLPYAMVLGVEREWAKQFEGIYNQPPSWYSDPSGGAFNSLILINSLNNFSHSANAALTVAPSSAAGGSSGFGGGGFSGGGFGGGGGGSW